MRTPSVPSGPGASGVRLRSVLSSGWIPAALVAAFAVAVLLRTGTPASDIAVFAAYLLVGVTLPGVLVWRRLRGERGWFAEDVAAGTVLGYALEVLAYLPARAVGHPRLFLLVPVYTIAAFALFPRLRRHWRGSGRAGRAHAWWSWSMAALAAWTIAGAGILFFQRHGLTWPGYASPYVDMPSHLALVGEVRHHVPPTVPYVAGEPLHYHWFAYAEMAATSWATGIEAQTLLYRLSALPIVLAGLVALSLTARRITGQVWGAVLVVATLVVGLVPSPYGWSASVVADGGNSASWLSPTQAFGAALCLPAVLLLTDLLRGDARRGRGRWILLALLLAAVTGAKATFLPLLLAGLALTIAVRFAVERRPPRTALAAFGLVLCFFAFAQVVLFGGASQGLRTAPLMSMKGSSLATLTGVVPRAAGWPPLLALVCAVFAVSYLILWCGLFGLVRRPSRALDPAFPLVLGMGLTGLAAMAWFGHPGYGQLYFLKSARPYLIIAAVFGLVTAWPRMERRHASWAAGLAAAGAGIVLLVRALAGESAPTLAKLGEAALVWRLIWPWLLLAGALVTAFLAIRRFAAPGAALACGLALMTGTTFAMLPAQAEVLAAAAHETPRPRTITAGALQAGRWLRDHSSPDDLVATNVHCRAETRAGCENRHFWISAYTERRMLVEGWGYTDRTSAQARLFVFSNALVPYWDPQRLADNDAAFRSPSAATIGRLRDRYGVRWLFVDENHHKPSAELPAFATFIHRAGGCAVYWIPAPGKEMD
ncbi:hypothetical protein GCM10010468_56270 [Actinocorallia longicatena]|uniref:Glycosyltransferase RgtA/B/C/D-like domain-containing protein n=1 Tax=Actinocorallia longicatena TaxID=111803 RepID=A0ABP6QFU6_9ACTN